MQQTIVGAIALAMVLIPLGVSIVTLAGAGALWSVTISMLRPEDGDE